MYRYIYAYAVLCSQVSSAQAQSRHRAGGGRRAAGWGGGGGGGGLATHPGSAQERPVAPGSARQRPGAPGKLGVWALKKPSAPGPQGCVSLGALHFVPEARWRIHAHALSLSLSVYLSLSLSLSLSPVHLSLPLSLPCLSSSHSLFCINHRCFVLSLPLSTYT